MTLKTNCHVTSILANQGKQFVHLIRVWTISGPAKTAPLCAPNNKHTVVNDGVKMRVGKEKPV